MSLFLKELSDSGSKFNFCSFQVSSMSLFSGVSGRESQIYANPFSGKEPICTNQKDKLNTKKSSETLIPGIYLTLYTKVRHYQGYSRMYSINGNYSHIFMSLDFNHFQSFWPLGPYWLLVLSIPPSSGVCLYNLF